MERKKTINFLATGDFHSDKSLVQNIKYNVNLDKIDYVLFIGDLSDEENDFKSLLSLFNGKKIFMVPGNHETSKGISNLEEHYNVNLIGNNPIIFEDELAIFGSNYMSIGPYGVFEEEVLENLYENFENIKNVKNKILLSHIPPHNTKIGDASPFSFIGGSTALTDFLKKKEDCTVLCGHIHESSGLEEKVFGNKVVNVGRTFKILKFNTETKKLVII